MTETHFDHRLLETFVKVAEAGTISLGAQRVHRTQSTVSAQIQQLEEDAGARLFDRGARRLSLTATGEKLLGLAVEILDMNQRAVTALRAPQSRQILRFGCSGYYRPHDLPRLVARTQRSFPDYSLEFTVGPSKHLEELITAGELDVAVVSSVARLRGARLLHLEPLAWIGAPDFRLPGGPLPLVLLGPECQIRRVALRALARSRRAVSVVLTSTSPVGVVAALEARLGVGCLNRHAVPPTLAVVRDSKLPPLPAVGFYALQRARNAAWTRLIDEFAQLPGI